MTANSVTRHDWLFPHSCAQSTCLRGEIAWWRLALRLDMVQRADSDGIGHSVSMKGRLVGRSLGWSLGTDLTAKGAVLVTTLIAVRSLQPSKFGVFIGMSAI